MKNKKILLTLSIIVIVLLLGVYYYFMIFKDYKAKLSVHEAGNFTKYTGELPKFDLKIGGTVNTYVDKQVLDYHKVMPYKFDAIIETNWGEYSNSYVGYKLKDILGILNIKNYSGITAYNPSGLRINYSADKIDKDTIFVVFYKDNETIFSGKMAIISVLDNAEYFLDNVVKIDINNVEAK